MDSGYSKFKKELCIIKKKTFPNEIKSNLILKRAPLDNILI